MQDHLLYISYEMTLLFLRYESMIRKSCVVPIDNQPPCFLQQWLAMLNALLHSRVDIINTKVFPLRRTFISSEFPVLRCEHAWIVFVQINGSFLTAGSRIDTNTFDKSGILNQSPAAFASSLRRDVWKVPSQMFLGYIRNVAADRRWPVIGKSVSSCSKCFKSVSITAIA